MSVSETALFSRGNPAAVFSEIRSSTQKLVVNSKDVKINSDAILRWMDTLDIEKVKKPYIRRFPLKFTKREEINFLCTLDLLNFGSGYRKLLHKYCNKGAYETMLYGCMGLHLQGSQLDADTYNKMTALQASQCFGIPTDVEEEVQGATYINKPGPLRPLVEQITNVLNETGRILAGLQCKDFYEYLEKILSSPAAKTKHPSATSETDEKAEFDVRPGLLVSELLHTFPAFNDQINIKGQTVYFFKKAQLLIADLYNAFREKEENPFDFSSASMDQFTVYADNVLPAVLRHLGIIEISENLLEKIESQKKIKAGTKDAELRAAAIAACEEIVSKSDNKFNAMNLDYYLWELGKEPEFRKVERHVTRDTVYY